MRKTIWGLLIGVVLVLSLSWAALAQETKEEPKPSLNGNVAFLSQYIWRGYELSKDSLVIQPSLTVGYRGFEFNLWANLDTNDHYTGKKGFNVNETDLTLSYTHDLGPVKLSGGYIYYGVEQGNDAQELYLKIIGNVLLSPTLSIYRDISYSPGWYLNLGFSHSFKLSKEITLDMGATFGYLISDSDNTVDYNSQGQPTTNKFNAPLDGNLMMGLTIPFAKYFSAKPVLNYSFPLSTDAKYRIKGTSLSNKSDFIYGGVIVTAAF
jgi:uncharacterized protein (TIGR02001 family)